MDSSTSRPISPSRMRATSPRVKPSTRRLASSRARSASVMRAELYTTPKFTMMPSSTPIMVTGPVMRLSMS